MQELSELTKSARRMMSEAAAAKKSGGVKDAKPSENVAEDCLKAANGFREAIKGGDKLEEAASKVAEMAKEAALTSDLLTAKRAAMDVESATVKMKQAVDSIYGPFAEARQAFYAVALAWDMYKPQASSGKKSSSDVKAMSDKDVAAQIEVAAKNLQTNVKDFLEKGAKASKLFRDAAKKLGLEQGELTASEKQALIDAAFAARTAADPLFGRSQGIARRAVELVARAHAKEKYEAKAKGVTIELAVEADPEFGGYELV